MNRVTTLHQAVAAYVPATMNPLNMGWAMPNPASAGVFGGFVASAVFATVNDDRIRRQSQARGRGA